MLRWFAVPLAAVALVAAAASSSADVSVRGKVVRVVDGDTVMVDVWGDGTTTPVAIRNAGLQAMEVGECHAAAATSVMTTNALNKTVRLTALSASSTSQGRPVRFVDRETSTGYVDTQLPVIQQGLALWLTIYPETWRAETYHRAMEAAAAKGIGLWDSDACGAGPSQTANLRLWVNYDGDGDESTNPNTEWVEVLNRGTTDVSVAGWRLRTAAHDAFTLPAGAKVPAGSTLRLYVGKGTNSTTRFYWGWSTPRFPNLTSTSRIGSGAYLVDPDGDIRAHATYPCVYGSCTDPLAGTVKVTANYDAPGDDMTNPNGEYVTITSTVTDPVDLSWYVVQVGGSTIEFGRGSVLKTQGSTLRVYVGKGTSTSTVKYWGKTSAIMPNGGGAAVLRNTEGTTVACTSWGTGSCQG